MGKDADGVHQTSCYLCFSCSRGVKRTYDYCPGCGEKLRWGTLVVPIEDPLENNDG